MRILALVLLAAVACRYPVRPQPPVGTPALIEHVLEAPPAAAVLGATLDGAAPARARFGRRGRYRINYASACTTNGRGNPLAWPDRKLPPTAGEPLHVLWTTTPTAPYLDVASVFLLASFGETTPVPLGELSDFTGCTLHVDTNPRNLFAFAPAAGTFLTQDGGHVRLDWTPPQAFAGTEVNLQLVVFARGSNPGGWLFSPGLELWIGSGD